MKTPKSQSRRTRVTMNSLFNGPSKWVARLVVVMVFGGLGVFYLQSSQATTKTCVNSGVIFKYIKGSVLKDNPKNGCIASIQQILLSRGITVKNSLTIDGSYGPITASAVNTFQRGYKTIGHDGKVGPATWKKLCQVAAASKKNSVQSAGKKAGCARYYSSLSKVSGSTYAVTSSMYGVVKKSTTTSSSSRKAGINLNREAMWDKIAKCESGNRWNINTGNGYYGGLQFNRATWLSVGGNDFASLPHQASREEQITIANRLYAKRGLQPWSCGRVV